MKFLRKDLFLRGFSLLEVMIALAILSIVAVTFLQSQVSGIRLTEEASQITMATLLAREKMAELESVGFPEIGTTSGKGGEDFSFFRFEQIVSATEIPALRKVLVRVRWGQGESERNLELIAYLAQK
jgi:general secretion pathway protein I